MSNPKKTLWNTKGLGNKPAPPAGKVQPSVVNAPPQAFAPPLVPFEQKKKTIKFLDQNWLIFEEDSKLYASHYCAGTAEFQAMHKQVIGEKKPWFHKAVDTAKADKCEACEEEIPKNLLMACKINNVNY